VVLHLWPERPAPGRGNAGIRRCRCKASREAEEEKPQRALSDGQLVRVPLPPNLIPSIFRCPTPLLPPTPSFLFYVPDDSCVFGPFAFEEARKRCDFLTLKKEKKTPFPQDVFY